MGEGERLEGRRGRKERIVGLTGINLHLLQNCLGQNFKIILFSPSWGFKAHRAERFCRKTLSSAQGGPPELGEEMTEDLILCTFSVPSHSFVVCRPASCLLFLP